MNLRTIVGQLRLLGIIEGISFLLLLGIAMPLKYLMGMPQAVKVVGMAHGVLFVMYVAWLLFATLKTKWGIKNAILGFLASLVPFGTFWADAKIFIKYQ